MTTGCRDALKCPKLYLMDFTFQSINNLLIRYQKDAVREDLKLLR